MKLEWVKKRLIEICLGVENVAMWDNMSQDFFEKVNLVQKKFPASNTGAFIKILHQTDSCKPQLDHVVKSSLNEARPSHRSTIEMPEAAYKRRPNTAYQTVRRSQS
jgi:hypothetical protein